MDEIDNNSWPTFSTYAFKSVISQRFSLPQSIIFYMAKNPKSGIGLKKLIETCKYFYLKNPVIVAEGIEIYESFYVFKFPKGCHSRSATYLNQLPCKFSLTESLEVRCWSTFDVLYPKLVHCPSLKTTMSEDEFIPFEGLKKAGKMKDLRGVFIYFHTGALIKYPNGSVTPDEAVFQLFPTIEEFTL